MQKILKNKIDIFLGFGFENYCLINAVEIADHLGASDRLISYGPMTIPNKVQIDLIFFRDDLVIHLVEIKFQNKEIDTPIMVDIEKKLVVLKQMFPKYSVVKNLISLSRPTKKLSLSGYFDKILLVEDLILNNK